MPICIEYHLAKGIRILDTDLLCKAEILNAYRAFQNKYMSRQAFDFEARLVLEKA